MPIKCDEDGNIYLRTIAGGERAKKAIRTIKTFDRNGSLKTTFALDASPDLSDFEPYDFAVAPNGDIYIAAARPKQIYVLSFGKDGNYKSKTELDHVFKPTQLTVFESGDFLLSGVELPRAEGDKPAPLTAIFSSSGKLTKKLPLDDRKSTSGKEADPDAPEGFNSGIELGIMLTGKDGNGYLLRRSSPTVVHIISPTGEVVRKLKIAVENSALSPDAMALAEGRLLVMLVGDQHERPIFKLVDSQSGEVEAEYSSSPEAGAALACFDGKELTFVGRQEDGRMLITHAAPR